MDDQFGNPKPPPECSPPPPNYSTFLEGPLNEDELMEEITVVPSMNTMDVSHSVPITLVTLPEVSSYQDTVSIEKNVSHSVGYSLPITPNHAAPLTSPDLQLARALASSQTDTQHLLIRQNGQLQIADSANEHLGYGHKKATPISYMDSVTQYIYSDGNHHGNTAL
jgi:hypothetical protein